MHSDDFTIDSLLDDLDDVVSTNHGDSKYSNPKYAPHPPNGEKSQSQVGITMIINFVIFAITVGSLCHLIGQIIAGSYSIIFWILPFAFRFTAQIRSQGLQFFLSAPAQHLLGKVLIALVMQTTIKMTTTTRQQITQV